MAWKPIIVAVDDSPESAAAAALGWRLAQAAGTSCHLVHAVRDSGTAFAAVLMQDAGKALEPALMELVGPRLSAGLRQGAPQAAIDSLAIRIGRPAIVFKTEVEKVGAGLLIIGGKHHLALGRWLAGSTALDAVRALTVPVLVTRDTPAAFGRVLVAVDLSYAAEPTIRVAERFATLVGAELRAIHVLEPLTLIPEAARFVEQQELNADLAATLERDVWPLLRVPTVEKTTRSGEPVAALAAEVAEWRADLLVVGSHGKGWADRLLLGTVTERLLNRLPVSLLVVPVRKPVTLESGAGPEDKRRRSAPPRVAT